jgi:hypothetical protein
MFRSPTFNIESLMLWVFNFLHQKLNAKSLVQHFVQLLFFSLFYVNWIDLEFVIHSFSLILLVNACVFQVSSANKVDLVLIEVPSNLSIG